MAKKPNEKHGGTTNPVRQLLETHRNPLVAINGINTLVRMKGKRFMGCIVEQLDGNRWLVMTVRHGFLEQGWHWLIAKRGIDKPVLLKQLGPIIMDPDPESDVAFLVVIDPQNTNPRPFTIAPQDFLIKKGQTLYNAQNLCDHTTALFEIGNAQQTVNELDTLAFCRLRETQAEVVAKTDHDRIERMLAEGRKVYRRLSMVSSAGYSGSPVWDNNFNMVGMNAQGNNGTVLLVPTGELYAARLRIETQLAQVLAGT